MKQRWTSDELNNYWTLTNEETELVNKTSKTDYNRIGYAVLLKYFQIEGKFPHRKQEIPDVVVEHIAQQLKVQSNEFKRYELQERVAKRHRVQIRAFLGVRVGTVVDAKTILAWLFTHDQSLGKADAEVVHTNLTKALNLGSEETWAVFDYAVRFNIFEEVNQRYAVLTGKTVPSIPEHYDNA